LEGSFENVFVLRVWCETGVKIWWCFEGSNRNGCSA